MDAARKAYAAIGVNVDAALEALAKVSLSLPVWQLDDIVGFEHGASGEDRLGASGLAVTGGRPGRPRTLAELRQDLEAALSLIPGSHRANLHALHGDFGETGFVDRDALTVDNFRSWMAWARGTARVELDFNPTMFSHPLAATGFTLSSKDEAVRRFWVEHCRRSREIAAAMGEAQATPCVNNVWIPDGFKDAPVDRAGHRLLLKKSLDEIFAKPPAGAGASGSGGGPPDVDGRHLVDAVEGKLFGVGLESATVGSNEFYLAYAASTPGITLTMDMGHFHPTESVADKVSAVLPFAKSGLLLHLSRPVRWDSDHVCVVNDELAAVAEEVVRSGALASGRVHLALDFFDASINRVGALVVGARAAMRAFLLALLQPLPLLKRYEEEGRLFERLALMEEVKAMPSGAVWNHFCEAHGVPVGSQWIGKACAYEADVLSKRE